MRSNDVILGLTNDIFNFTTLHEWVSIKTGIPLGSYSHFTSSLHLYVSDIAKLDFGQVYTQSVWPFTMDPMPLDFHPNQVYDQISKVSKMSIEECFNVKFESQYERDLFLACAFFYHSKEKGSENLLTMIDNASIRTVSSYWRKE